MHTVTEYVVNTKSHDKDHFRREKNIFVKTAARVNCNKGNRVLLCVCLGGGGSKGGVH